MRLRPFRWKWRSAKSNASSVIRKEVSLSREPFTRGPYDAIAAMVGSDSAECDRDGHFPISAFNGLREVGLIARPPLTAVEAGKLFRLLATIGLGDLSVGRNLRGPCQRVIPY